MTGSISLVYQLCCAGSSSHDCVIKMTWQNDSIVVLSTAKTWPTRLVCSPVLIGPGCPHNIYHAALGSNQIVRPFGCCKWSCLSRCLQRRLDWAILYIIKSLGPWPGQLKVISQQWWTADGLGGPIAVWPENGRNSPQSVNGEQVFNTWEYFVTSANFVTWVGTSVFWLLTPFLSNKLPRYSLKLSQTLITWL